MKPNLSKIASLAMSRVIPKQPEAAAEVTAEGLLRPIREEFNYHLADG